MRRLVWLVLVGLLFMVSIVIVSAEDLSEWKYIREIIIKGNSGKTLTDYQVLIELNSANFDFSKAKPDGSDIRFTDENGNKLPYWIEEWNYGRAKIWVKVPKIPANSETKIFMHYGNPNAVSKSNGDTVFEFFDDFNGNTLNTNKWTVICPSNNGEYIVRDGNLIMWNKNGILTDWWHGYYMGKPKPTLKFIVKANYNLPENALIRIKMKVDNDYNNHHVGLALYSDDYHAVLIGDFRQDSSGRNGFVMEYIDSTGHKRIPWTTTTARDIWKVLEVIHKGSTTQIKLNDETLTDTFTVSFVPTKLALMHKKWGDYPPSLYVHYDWILVAKYVEPQPTVIVGEEQETIPKPKLTLTIQTDTELKEGETRYSKLIVRNEGTAPAQNVMVTIFSQGLNIQITENIGMLQPQESREIPFYVEAKYSGQYKVFAKAEYTDGLNKYIETAEQIITVKALLLPSNIPANQPEKGDVSITLRSDVVKAKVGQEFSVTLSVTNYIVNPDMTLQIILKPPSGLSITSTEFAQTGVGEYSAVYHVKSGESKAIKIFLKPNNAGEFVIRGEVIYYFGNDKENFKKLPISERIIVVSSEEELKQQTSSKQEQIINKTPGFEAVLFVIAMVLAVRRCKR